MFVRIGVISGHKLTAADLAAQRRAQRKLKKKNMTSSEIEKHRRDQNLDYASMSSPLREYVFFAHMCNKFAESSFFNNYILVCILIAGLLVGIQTYPSMNGNTTLAFIDNIILYSFTTEVVVKIFGEGLEPHLYFTGKEWKWNWFDFMIVLFSMPFIPFAAGQIKLLRLIRLMRLAKVFRKIPQLQMIIMGLVGGMKSIVYIVILMFLTFYMYAIVGVLFFRINDPWSFHSIEITMINLLRVATLDGWGDMLYVNYFGCDKYNPGMYVYDRSEQSTKLGGMTYCGTPNPQPYLATLYFVSFIFISAFCILSLFIGAISMSMGESMITMKREKEEREATKERDKIKEVLHLYTKRDLMSRKLLRIVKLVDMAFQGQEIVDFKHDVDPTSLKEKYKWLSYRCQDFVDNFYFQQFVTVIILLAGVLVGIGTDVSLSLEWEFEIYVLGQIVQAVFVLELVLKVAAEELRPMNFFNDNWNIFDFIVVLASFLPTGSGSAVTILRLLRLLRVLKLMRALKQLQVIVAALMDGISSIGFISVILLMSYYFFGIIGMTFFSENDPWHFSTLHMAMLTLFDTATLDGWSNVMYISLYGCEQYPGNYPEECTRSTPMFAFAALFWLFFVLFGSLILLTLFIGVVSMGMEEAKRDQLDQAKVDSKAAKLTEKENLSPDTVALYKEVYNFIDISSSGKIGRDEMKFGLQVANVVLAEDEFEDLWKKVDRDGSNYIDFAEFLVFILDLRAQFHGDLEYDENGHMRPKRKRQTYMQLGRQSSMASVNENQDEHSIAESNELASISEINEGDNGPETESGKWKSATTQRDKTNNDMNELGLSAVSDFHSITEDRLVGTSHGQMPSTPLVKATPGGKYQQLQQQQQQQHAEIEMRDIDERDLATHGQQSLMYNKLSSKRNGDSTLVIPGSQSLDHPHEGDIRSGEQSFHDMAVTSPTTKGFLRNSQDWSRGMQQPQQPYPQSHQTPQQHHNQQYPTSASSSSPPATSPWAYPMHPYQLPPMAFNPPWMLPFMGAAPHGPFPANLYGPSLFNPDQQHQQQQHVQSDDQSVNSLVTTGSNAINNINNNSNAFPTPAMPMHPMFHPYMMPYFSPYHSMMTPFQQPIRSPSRGDNITSSNNNNNNDNNNSNELSQSGEHSSDMMQRPGTSQSSTADMSASAPLPYFPPFPMMNPAMMMHHPFMSSGNVNNNNNNNMNSGNSVSSGSMMGSLAAGVNDGYSSGEALNSPANPRVRRKPCKSKVMSI